MPKTFLKHFFIFLLCLFITNDSIAAPSIGPEMPKKWKWILGYESDLIFKRKLVDDYGRMRTFQHFFTMSVGIFDWLSLDGAVGIGDVKTCGGSYPTVKYDYGFAGKYGFRVRLYEDKKNGIRVVSGFQHISVHPPGKNVDNNKNQAIVDDWQGSALISKKIGNFEPYIGAKISECDLIHKLDETNRKRRKSELSGGVFLGTEFYFKQKIKANVEARFIDETAVSGGVSYIF